MVLVKVNPPTATVVSVSNKIILLLFIRNYHLINHRVQLPSHSCSMIQQKFSADNLVESASALNDLLKNIKIPFKINFKHHITDNCKVYYPTEIETDLRFHASSSYIIKKQIVT